MQVDIELCCLAQGCLYASYLGNLASDVEVYESQTVVQPHLVDLVECCEQLGTCQTKLGCIAATVSPLAGA